MIKCTFDNGSQTSLRHVATHALVVRNNQILMVKRAPHLTMGGKYGLPGGYLDRDETTTQGVLRELKEETGYEGSNARLFRICDNPYRRGEDLQNVAFTFLVDAGELTGEPDNESTEIKWFDLSNLPAPDEFAFDHLENIQLLQEYLQNPSAFQLPVLK